MTNSLDRKPNSAISRWRTQKGDDPAWLWWLVAGSSIAAHVLLLNLTLPFSSRLSSTASSSSNPIAIDLVKLPSDEPPAPSAAKPITATPTATSAPNPVPAATAPAAPSTPPNAPAYTPPVSTGDIAFAPSVPPVPPAPIPSAAAPFQSVPAQTPTSLPQLEPAPLPSSPPTIAPQFPEQETNNSSPEPAPSPETAAPASPTPPLTEGESIQNSASASAPATPTAPQIVTVPIDVPVPDVSETLPIPPSPIAQSLEEVETPEQAIPVMLTASLTATPAPDATEQPETIARPSKDSETLDPRSSSCQVTPEVIPYLGRTVAVQVTTNEAGQATDASIRQSSSSPIYDDLAVCMVKQWQFEPAMSQGSPVVSDALVVAVRIE